MIRELQIVLLACCLVGCAMSKSKTVDTPAVRAMCEHIQAQYPAATLQDIYKTCYQDFFGAEHLMRDTAAARQYLHYELEQCAGQDLSAMPAGEPTGFRHRFIRINLAEVTSGRMSADELLRLFIDAAGKDNAYSSDWASEWTQIEAVALDVNPAWQNDELRAALREAAQMNAAVHHSEPFRNAYNPHYRIIRNKQ